MLKAISIKSKRPFWVQMKPKCGNEFLLKLLLYGADV